MNTLSTLRMLLSLMSVLTGSAVTFTGALLGMTHSMLAEVPSASVITDATPVTLGIVLGGFSLVAGGAWKLARTLSAMENKITVIEVELRHLKGDGSQGKEERHHAPRRTV